LFARETRGLQVVRGVDLFARETRGLQVVRGVDLKGSKAAGWVTGAQWGGGVG
jgi:hypothetical protein